MKTCKKCGSVDFYKSGGCMPCAKERSKIYREKNPLLVSILQKEWREKNKEKLKEKREKNADKRSGYQKEKYQLIKNDPEFKEKNRAKAKKWRLENPEKYKLQQESLSDTQKEQKKIYQKEYNIKNAEKKREYTKKWRSENAEHVKKAKAERHRKHPEVAKRNNINRKARVRSVGGKLSRGIIKKLYLLQRGLCPCCGEKLLDDYHLDHIIPIALGGKNSDDNVQLLKSTCNLRKNAKHPIDYMQSKGFLL